jgi:archaellum component FlaC
MKYKARDVERLFRELGTDRASVVVLVEIIEHIGAMNEQMNELTNVCNKLIDTIAEVAGGFGHIRKEVERIRGKIPEDEQ